MEEENTQQIQAPVATAQNYAIPFAIVIAGLAIASAIYFGNNKEIAPTAQANTSVDPVTKDDHILGDPNAKIVIVEYSDTECPYCKTFHPTMQRIISEYGRDSKVAWVYRHFPLSIHSKASKEAEATECAYKLGGNVKFWEYLNKVFEVTPGNNGLDTAELPKIAEGLGLDVAAFNKCLDSGETKAKIDASLASGTKAGVSGTPYPIVLIDGKVVGVIGGALPYEELKKSIDASLEQK